MGKGCEGSRSLGMAGSGEAAEVPHRLQLGLSWLRGIPHHPGLSCLTPDCIIAMPFSL